MSQEEERKRISRDLHDDISSKLIAVSLNLHLLKSEKTKESSKADIIENTSIINNKAIESSRKIAHHLYPPVLEKFGLVQALKELVLDFNKTKVVSIRFNSEIKFENETSNFHLQIFRIIQELINNSIKHGQATIIEMKFRQHNSVNQFFYIDNGVGFDSSKIEKYRGLGFSNIENRIQNINGTYNMFSEVNEGFQFEFSF
ncbi:sensor histidine kinase [Lacinutrix cladophorae]